MMNLYLLSLRKLFTQPLFILGLVIRIGMIALVLPSPVSQWYIPFLDNSIQSFGLDPWQTWLNQDGAPLAFPYGYVMWLFFLPFALLCKVLAIPAIYGYGLTLVAADLGLLLLLCRLLQAKDGIILAVYWLSPISLIASYWMGFNDIVPVFLLVSSLYLLKHHRLLLAGMLLVAAISAKLSMVLSIPFFLIYLIHNQSLRQLIGQFLYGLMIGCIATLLPFAFSSAGLQMISSNPEMEKVYSLSVGLVRNTSIYLVPLFYLLMLYAAWRIKRINFELFNAILGMSFLLVVLLTPASPGWFIWVVPLLVAYQVSGDRAAILITSIFSVLYVLSAAILVVPGLEEEIFIHLSLGITSDLMNLRLVSLIHTALVATGVVLALRIWRETVVRNDYFRLSRKPFVIGVAGDSGAGKDTFAAAITGLFGSHSVASISGDDYHLWDRHQPMWQVMTHINPMANDLEQFATNLVALTDGKSIQTRHYDHETGRMSRPFTVKSNDMIISSGLHALYLPILRECYDLSIYLDINEDLRTFFKLQRDVNQRGYSKERVLEVLAKRQTDSDRFIKPQAAFADLVFSLQPTKALVLDTLDLDQTPRLKLSVTSRHGFNELSLKRILVGVCGLHVEMNTQRDNSEIELMIEGETSERDIALAAQLLCPQIFEFLDIEPQWRAGVTGLMQLVTLSHINQALTRRFI